MTDQEREDYIKECGARMEAAYLAGNRQEAEQWLQAQNVAIKARSAAQVARMEDDYFSDQGAADRAVLERRAA